MIMHQLSSKRERKIAFLMAALDQIAGIEVTNDIGDYIYSLIPLTRTLENYPMGLPEGYKDNKTSLYCADSLICACLAILALSELTHEDINRLNDLIESAFDAIVA